MRGRENKKERLAWAFHPFILSSSHPFFPCLLASFFLATGAEAQLAYQKPPASITSVLEAPRRPDLILSPAKDRALVIQRDRYRTIDEMALPMLGLGGLRINPRSNSPARQPHVQSAFIENLSDGRQVPLDLPKEGAAVTLAWSPDGKHIAYTVVRDDRTEIWVADAGSGQSKRLVSNCNATFGGAFRWMPGSQTLLVNLVPNGRGDAPVRLGAPEGPEIQDNGGKKRAVRTLEDLLKDSFDDGQFSYYMTSQLALVDIGGGERHVGEPGIVRADPSPDGKKLIVDVVHPPFSHRLDAAGFPHRTELWSLDGSKPAIIADAKSAETVPLDGVETGPRNVQWRADKPETLFWVEALDEGNPRNSVPFRDRLVLQEPGAQPREIGKCKDRFRAVYWGADNKAILAEYDRDREHNLLYAADLSGSQATTSLLSDISSRELYNNPGSPLLQMTPNGHEQMVQDGAAVLFSGRGSSPEGDRPFLDKVNLISLKSTRLWRCDTESFESVVGTLADDGSKFVTLRETPTDYPNYFLHDGAGATPLTKFANPYPQLTGIKKQLISYKRSDGVECSFTLYLPPDYKPGTRLPAIMEAYPLEFTDASTASQFSGSTKTFPIFSGVLVFVLEGYAVMNNVAMPIVGDPETVNDNFVPQLVEDARAAIAKADELGVIDPKRVGIMGHSYGAFMTANLLANSDLIAAGAAESGAYNRTLTPFGFQSERRTFWQAPKMYGEVSPFFQADKIKRPLLLIHGIQDDNPGTFTIQSERLYQAIAGNGGTVRLVLLPFEAHGYAARESIEHVIWEELRWFDKYVKGSG